MISLRTGDRNGKENKVNGNGEEAFSEAAILFFAVNCSLEVTADHFNYVFSSNQI